MSFFENLVSVYTSGKPKGFRTVAPRLREGTSTLRIRDQLMEERNLSRMRAGKIVEGVEKHVKAIKANLWSGAGFLLFGLVFFLFINALSFAPYFLMFLGVVQLVAGTRGWRSYKQAGSEGRTATGAADLKGEQAV